MSDANQQAAFVAKVPGAAAGGQLGIRHSPPTHRTGFEVVVSWDVAGVTAMQAGRHFDSTGKEFVFAEERLATLRRPSAPGKEGSMMAGAVRARRAPWAAIFCLAATGPACAPSGREQRHAGDGDATGESSDGGAVDAEVASVACRVNSDCAELPQRYCQPCFEGGMACSQTLCLQGQCQDVAEICAGPVSNPCAYHPTYLSYFRPARPSRTALPSEESARGTMLRPAAPHQPGERRRGKHHGKQHTEEDPSRHDERRQDADRRARQA